MKTQSTFKLLTFPGSRNFHSQRSDEVRRLLASFRVMSVADRAMFLKIGEKVTRPNLQAQGGEQ